MFGAKPSFGNGSNINNPFGGATTKLFGANQSSSPVFGTSSSSPFGGSFVSGATPRQVSPFPGPQTQFPFGTQAKPAVPASSSSPFGGSFVSGTTPGQRSAFTSPQTQFPIGTQPKPVVPASSSSPFGGSFVSGATPRLVNPFPSPQTQFPFGKQAKPVVPGITSAQSRGSKVARYVPRSATDINKGRNVAVKMMSISSMQVYEGKSHEELRWEDLELGNTAVSSPFGPSAKTSIVPFTPTSSSPTPIFNPVQPSTFPSQSIYGPPSTSPFTKSGFSPVQSSTFPSQSIFFPSSTTQPTPTVNHFAPDSFTTQPTTTGVPVVTTSSFTLSGSPFPQPTPTASPFPQNSFNTQASGFLQTTTPLLGQTNCTLRTTTSNLLNTAPLTLFPGNCSQVHTNNLVGFDQSRTSSMTLQIQPIPTTPSSVQPNMPNLASTGFEGKFVPSQPTQVTVTSSLAGQSTVGNLPVNQGPIVTQQLPKIPNPFGTLPTMPQMPIGRPVQHGISSIPINDKPTPIRVSSLLTSPRCLSERRIKLPTRKYQPKDDCQKVPFYSNEEESPRKPKADALYFVPRENPREFVVHLMAKCSVRGIVPEGEPDTETHMPKISRADYYIEPPIQELAAKERAEPGFCRHVKDFVVGRHGYGSIKFIGETDVRQLDLESLVQFNNREVIVYVDESMRPPIGQGLNKSAVVTLLNIKCFDKKTGQQLTEGPIADKYKQLLIQKAQGEGAAFLSYDPFKGEWKFKVNHF